MQTVRAAARADGPKLERQHVSRYRTSTWSINHDLGTSGEGLGALKTSNVSRLVAWEPLSILLGNDLDNRETWVSFFLEGTLDV
mgnify:CR=1 FL=1